MKLSERVEKLEEQMKGLGDFTLRDAAKSAVDALSLSYFAYIGSFEAMLLHCNTTQEARKCYEKYIRDIKSVPLDTKLLKILEQNLENSYRSAIKALPPKPPNFSAS